MKVSCLTIKADHITMYTLEDLRPHTDESRDNIIESTEDYCHRFQKIYPNFPIEVIKQLFYDHPDAIDDNKWLKYETLKFKLSEFSIKQILQNCFLKHDAIKQYCEYFVSGTRPPRITSLANYISVNKTWPIPPIVLQNINSEYLCRNCLEPYHLLEGHHRFAALLALSESIELSAKHQVWICYKGIN